MTNKPGPEEKLEEDRGLSDFLGDEEPKGQLAKAKYWLMKQKAPEEVREMGPSAATVRIAEHELIRDGFLPKRSVKRVRLSDIGGES